MYEKQFTVQLCFLLCVTYTVVWLTAIQIAISEQLLSTITDTLSSIWLSVMHPSLLWRVNMQLL